MVYVDYFYFMDFCVGCIGLKSEDVVYFQEDVGRRVIVRVFYEIKVVMVWDVSQCMGEGGILCFLKIVVDLLRVEEEFYFFLDSMQSVVEVFCEVEELEVSRFLLYVIDDVCCL